MNLHMYSLYIYTFYTRMHIHVLFWCVYDGVMNGASVQNPRCANPQVIQTHSATLFTVLSLGVVTISLLGVYRYVMGLASVSDVYKYIYTWLYILTIRSYISMYARTCIYSIFFMRPCVRSCDRSVYADDKRGIF